MIQSRGPAILSQPGARAERIFASHKQCLHPNPRAKAETRLPFLCENKSVHPQLPALIFDLDGTLTDSKPGILGCLRNVLDALHIDAQGSLDRFIGPPVEEWTVELLPDASEEDRATLAREYRACYDREGWKNNSVFPGVLEMLTELRDHCFPLYVCTSKHHRFAIRILDAFELSGFFNAIYGDKAEYASHAKADLLANLIREHHLNKSSVWMIGDRSFDIEAAHANGIPCLAAAWGYGSPQECAHAEAIATTPPEVLSVILKETDQRAASAAPPS
jgi:phosphoglycolate phosphatase